MRLITILAVTTLFFFSACSKVMDPNPASDDTLKISLKNTDVYEHQTGISGDEEGAAIVVQARHYEISDIVRNAETGWAAVYRFKPQAGYKGTDYVEIELRTGSDGAGPATKIEIIKIRFQIY